MRDGVQLEDAEQSWRRVWVTWASFVDAEEPEVGSNKEVAERSELLHDASSALVSRAWRKAEHPALSPLSGM